MNIVRICFIGLVISLTINRTYTESISYNLITRKPASQLPNVGLASAVHVAQGVINYLANQDNPAALPALGIAVVQGIAAIIQTAINEKETHHHHCHHHHGHHCHGAHKSGVLEVFTTENKEYSVTLIGNLFAIINLHNNISV